jgi:hypothetical protein
MASKNFYKFLSLESANAAIALINASLNIPINYNGIPLFSITKNYCEIKEINDNFYIEKDSVTEAVSDNWIEETINFPETDDNGVPL